MKLEYYFTQSLIIFAWTAITMSVGVYIGLLIRKPYKDFYKQFKQQNNEFKND